MTALVIAQSLASIGSIVKPTPTDIADAIAKIEVGEEIIRIVASFNRRLGSKHDQRSR
jgi:hypothetical protein